MKRPRRPFIVHHLILPIIPILFVFVHNLEGNHTSFLTLFMFIAGTLGLAILVMAATKLTIKDKNRASIISSSFFILLFFFPYGYLFERPVVSTLTTLVFLGSIIAFFAVSFATVKSTRALHGTVRFLNYFSIGFIVILAIQGFYVSITAPTPHFEEKAAKTELAPRHPDIFYIVLDAYGRQDVLKELYEYDNSDLINFLKGSGFYVASKSRTNYSLTLPSLASSLNYEYLDRVRTEMGETSRDKRPLVDMIKQSKIRRLLAAYGYKFLAFSSGCNDTEIEDADVYLKPSSSLSKIGEFEYLVLKNNLLGLLFRMQIAEIGSYLHRERILYTTNRLFSLPFEDSPAFIFAHIMAPHPPFVFSESKLLSPYYLFADGSALHHMDKALVKTYARAYVDQVKVLNSLIKQCVTAIQKRRKDSIIIIQSDHGPRSGTDWGSLTRTNLTECTSILNAIYLPKCNTSLLHEGITPVNTFRVVLKEVFSEEIALLDDKTYFVPGLHQPYRFVPVDSTDTGVLK